jgi:hypothetical protein
MAARILLLTLLLAWASLVFWNCAKPLPPGTHIASQISRVAESDVDFLYESPQRATPKGDEMAAIDRAEQLIVLDRSPVTRPLALRLMERKRARPNIKIVLVTDPGNEIFGGTPRRDLASLERAGIIVSRVRLDRLRDSNPLYSGLWRLVVGWWSDPFDESDAKVTLPAWARMQNYKADQRQLMVADDGSGGWIAMIAPAGGAAPVLALRGGLARSMIAGELQIAGWSTDDDRLPPRPPMESRGVGAIDARYLTEGAIGAALLEDFAAAGSGDDISVAVDAFSDRRLISAALQAAARGARVRVLLTRKQMPNSSVAGDLERGGAGRIEVRWHEGGAGALPKLLLVRHGSDLWLNVGSANFTRRNLDDLNLEAAVELHMPARAAPARAAGDYFGKLWAGAAAGEGTAEVSAADYWRYRFAEATGLSSF